MFEINKKDNESIENNKILATFSSLFPNRKKYLIKMLSFAFKFS